MLPLLLVIASLAALLVKPADALLSPVTLRNIHPTVGQLAALRHAVVRQNSTTQEDG